MLHTENMHAEQAGIDSSSKRPETGCMLLKKLHAFSGDSLCVGRTDEGLI